MFKKVLLGTLLAGLIGVLVAGAAIRTADKTGQTAEAQGQGRGQGRVETAAYAEEWSGWGQGGGQGQGNQESSGNGSGGQGQGNQESSGNGDGGQGQGEQGGNGNGKGSRGQAADSPPGDQTGTGQAQMAEWLALQGAVVSVDKDALVVQIDSGAQVIVDGRAWSFAREQEFSAEVGDQVTLVGFYEDGDFEVGQIDDLTNGQTALLRDEDGRPMWAGRGYRGGRGA
jgi:hypothetical protein